MSTRAQLIRAFNLPIFIPSAHDSFPLSITAIPKKNHCPFGFYDAEISKEVFLHNPKEEF
jgi:hypothetical protein